VSHRRLFNITSAVSLLLCIATVALWVRSYRVYDWLGHSSAYQHGEWTRIRLASGIGGIEFNFQRLQQQSPPPPESAGFFFASEPAYPSGIFAPAPDPETFWYRHNFASVNIHWSWWTYVGFLVPHWLVAALLTILPIVSFRRYRHGTAHGAGHPCAHCGYDLTANTSGICPECGTPVPAVGIDAVES
jgi:hypothetical protein